MKMIVEALVEALLAVNRAAHMEDSASRCVNDVDAVCVGCREALTKLREPHGTRLN